MRVINLFSGSEGNATLIYDGQTGVLIDAGKSASAINKALNSVGLDASAVNAVFITHEHIDHTSGLEVFAKKSGAPAFVPSGCLEMLKAKKRIKTVEPTTLENGQKVKVGTLEITAVRVPHDSDECFGYLIKGGQKTVGVFTDIGKVTEELLDALKGCDGAVVESNHDPDMLENESGYPASLRCRIASECGHLSNAQCAVLIDEAAKKGRLKTVLLAHLSAHSNTKSLALSTANAYLKCRGRNISVSVSDRNEPTELILE